MAEQRHELGRRIQTARLEKRWKQKQLAAAVNVEPITVSRWETGRHMPDLDMLEMIAQATGKPVAFFVDEPPVIPDAQAARLEDLLGRVIELLEEVLAERPEGPAGVASKR